jgi:hypothetical protein
VSEASRVAVSAPVAEVVGPPGSGKTSLVKRLGSDGVVTISNLRRQHPYLFLRNTLALAPMLKAAGPLSSGSWIRWTYLVRLRAALALSAKCAARGVTSLVFDQGPVFALARLRHGSPSASVSPAISRSLDEALSDWADTLKLVVVLDAPDDVLISRIRSRSKSHAVKNRDDESARRALALHRQLFDAVIKELDVLGRLRIRRYDTSLLNPRELANLVVGDVRESPRERPVISPTAAYVGHVKD